MIADLPIAALQGSRSPARLSRQLSCAAIVMLIAVSLASIGGLYWSTHESDEVSVERQVRLARHSINIALDELALQQETVAIWDNSSLEMAREVRDQQWLFDNIGSWLHRIFGHDEVYLVDGYDQPVQSVVAGKRVPNARYWALHKEFELLLHSVRGDVSKPGPHDRIQPHPLAAGSTVLTTERASHDTHLMLIGGRPAAASAMLIKPSTPGYVRPIHDWPALISVRYLDGGFLQELRTRYLIEGARYASFADRSGDEQALRLESDWRQPLGYLIWKPELPGSRILESVLPVALFGLAALSLLMLLLTRNLAQTLNERAALEARAAHLAFHDSLTGLPNRTLLNERLSEALANRPMGTAVALLLIDLDRFKQVNDTLGHLAGDQLIREFAGRLSAVAGPSDTVARLGGDEFAVLLIDRRRPSQIDSICASIIELFRVPFSLSDAEVFGGGSIGAVRADSSVKDATELLRRADVALYRAKAEGRGCARLYDEHMDERGKARAVLEAELREAVTRSEFALWAQPQVDRNGEQLGQELLLRWNRGPLGFVSASAIIPLAEETGLIKPIGNWILQEAALVAAATPEQFTAINLSPVQLADRNFASRLIDLFAATGSDPARTELEVTEQVMLDDAMMASRNIQQLRTAGFRIALDDFGTGYSSLSYLRQLAVDKIKIDRSFVADLHHSKDARAIVAAIVTLGHAIGLIVSAEGVETKAQADILLAAGCDQLQGFLFGAPEPAVIGIQRRATG